LSEVLSQLVRPNQTVGYVLEVESNSRQDKEEGTMEHTCRKTEAKLLSLEFLELENRSIASMMGKLVISANHKKVTLILLKHCILTSS